MRQLLKHQLAKQKTQGGAAPLDHDMDLSRRLPRLHGEAAIALAVIEEKLQSWDRPQCTKSGSCCWYPGGARLKERAEVLLKGLIWG